MPSGGLLLLLDDVAALSSAAAKKTAGIVGDDLALNSKALIGIDPARELPIVWKVTKGSLKNKAILIPGALILSAFAPIVILPLMMLGGAFLCFEGAEKIIHAWQHWNDPHPEKEALETLSSAEMEKQKVSAAIRTDMILSAEIIVVTLGSVAASATLLTKTLVLVTISLGMTVVVYGTVALLVKLDDMGLHLMEKPGQTTAAVSQRRLGYALVQGTPVLLKAISILGTAAMFTVGGGIVLHGMKAIEKMLHDMLHNLAGDGFLNALLNMLASGLFGLALGFLCVPIVNKLLSIIKSFKSHTSQS